MNIGSGSNQEQRIKNDDVLLRETYTFIHHFLLLASCFPVLS